MALNGTIIVLPSFGYGFEYITALHNEPTKVRQVWPIAALRSTGFGYCSNDDAIGKPATLTDGRVSCYLGQGKWVNGALPEGGQTKSVVLETTPIAAPKCRSETRWQNGAWQKYSARKGWIAA